MPSMSILDEQSSDLMDVIEAVKTLDPKRRHELADHAARLVAEQESHRDSTA